MSSAIEAAHSSWTELHGEFGSIQEHELRRNPEFIRYRSHDGIGTS